MGWYAVHIIMYVNFKDGNQDKYPIWENIYLIEAELEDEAIKKGNAIGTAAEGDSDGTFHWENRPATWVFAGIRKLIACQRSDEKPGDGTEISYSEMLVDNKDSLSKLINGEPVIILYEE